MKQTTKHVLSSACFILGILVMLVLMELVLTPKDSTDAAGMEEVYCNAFVAETDNVLDVILLGNSESFAAFSPTVMWEEAGFTAYVYGTVGQQLDETEMYLDRMLRTQHPKIVVIETNELYTDITPTTIVFSRMQNIIPGLFHHDRWKSFRLSDLYRRPEYTHRENPKGYIFRSLIDPAYPEDYMAYSEDVEIIMPDTTWLLRQMHQNLQEQGIQLMLVSTPSSVNWSYPRHNWIAKVAEEENIPFLDVNLQSDEFTFDWAVDSQDKGDHLNYYGAEKTSIVVARWLMQSGLLEDHRDDPAPVYRTWAEDCKNARALFDEMLADPEGIVQPDGTVAKVG